ncbi:hypothetical protein PWT90_03433 [Aphanocladium album]|nr:hypothetical protein PWT90_03433 [Aphanocladium album]
MSTRNRRFSLPSNLDDANAADEARAQAEEKANKLQSALDQNRDISQQLAESQSWLQFYKEANQKLSQQLLSGPANRFERQGLCEQCHSTKREAATEIQILQNQSCRYSHHVVAQHRVIMDLLEVKKHGDLKIDTQLLKLTEAGAIQEARIELLQRTIAGLRTQLKRAGHRY